MNIEYKIAAAASIEELEIEVNELLKGGFELYGPLNFQLDSSEQQGVMKTYFFQAMIKKDAGTFTGAVLKGKV